MEMKVEIISREAIKPSSPTPHHLRILSLSILDILNPPIYTGAILFYSHQSVSAEISQKLKKSLSETLIRFYPFAGRINGKSIDCNDEGAVFTDAKVGCFLSDFLRNPDPESLKHLVPVDARSTEAVTWPVLLIQANSFLCGGFAISIFISHKITDASSLATFIQGWGATTQGLDNTVTPLFTAATVFPPPPQIPFTSPEKIEFKLQNCSTKRFLFYASRVTELKIKAKSPRVKNPTRVEAVTALLWKCATKASRLNSGALRPSVLQQPVNLRRRISTLLSENSIGNLLSLFLLKNEEREMQIQGLVSELRQKKEEFDSACEEKFEGVKASLFVLELGNEMGKLYSKGNELDLYTITSWCKLSLYEADFGWGKPLWVTGRGTSMFNNLIQLIDAEDGEGIEAWVTLTEEDMSVFEHDQELLEFASLNPSILI